MSNLRDIIPVVLCGGKGSRLWPLSNSQTPKHFLHFGDQHSLFQKTLLRCPEELFDPRPIVVTNLAHRDTALKQLRAIGKKADMCLEAIGRNSCPAIVYACYQALERSPDPTLLILPADHWIENTEAFHHLVSMGRTVSADHLVTFGFKPDGPHTGYGYIETGSKIASEHGSVAFAVKKFIEKPDEAKALQLCDAGYLWNGGIFLINARLFLEEMEKLQPELLELTKRAFFNCNYSAGIRELSIGSLEKMPSLSVDHGIFERSSKVAVCPADLDWRDIGNWDRAASLYPQDSLNNRVEGRAEFCESTDNFVHSPHHKTCLVGVDNLAVVVTKDAVLVTHRKKCEKTALLSDLAETPDLQVNMFADHDRRPWGEFHRIDLGDGYQVKRLRVEPGQCLSLQSHCHRSEHWIVVSGMAEVTIGTNTKSCGVDESVFIPKGSVHRLANKSDEPLILIEVQTGDYFGEDDIVRLEDDYDRVKK